MMITVRNTFFGLASGLSVLLSAGGVQALGQMAVHEVVSTAKIVRHSPALDAVIATDVKIEKIATGLIYVDGLGVGDISDVALRDRRHLSEDGVLIVVTTLSDGTATPPEVISRGFAESEELLSEMRNEAYEIVRELEHRPDVGGPDHVHLAEGRSGLGDGLLQGGDGLLGDLGGDEAHHPEARAPRGSDRLGGERGGGEEPDQQRRGERWAHPPSLRPP